MPFAAAVSTHPVTATATGEVAGQVLEQLGAHPDLVCCFVTAAHAGALEDIGAAVRAVLSPTVLLGCASGGVLANSTEVERGAGIALWAGILGPVAPLRVTGFEAGGGAPGAGIAGAAIGNPPFRPGGVVVLGDAGRLDAGTWLDALRRQHPGVAAAGALVGTAGPPGPGIGSHAGTALLIDDRVVVGGAVGAVLGPGGRFDAVVSQGCRLIGQPLTVTRAERNVIYDLAGAPAFSRLLEIAHDQMPAEEIRLINEGLQLGVLAGERAIEPGSADFVMHPVHGADPANGAIAVGGEVEVGAVVQFSVQDADAADQDLHEVLADRQADGVLLFPAAARGSRLFVQANHDVEVVGEELEFPPLAGCFSAAELGPAGPNGPAQHAQSAALALFRDR